MSKHVVVYSTKGGVGKSTFVLYIQWILSLLKKKVSVINMDSQEHVEAVDQDDSDYYLYDCAGVHDENCQRLLDAAKDLDYVIIIPIGLGRNDAKEVRFIANNLEAAGVLDNSYFVYNKIRSVSSNLLKERRSGVRGLGLQVAKTSIRNLDDIADHKKVAKTKNEFSKLVHEVIV